MFKALTEEKILQMLRDYTNRFGINVSKDSPTKDLFEPNRGVVVKITGAAAGGGKYTGRILQGASSDVSASGNLAAADFGYVPAADNALILNNQETGLSTHDLTGSANTIFTFPGVVIRTNSDGTRVVAINGFFYGC